MRFVLTAQAWEVILRHGRPAAQTLGRYRAENICTEVKILIIYKTQ